METTQLVSGYDLLLARGFLDEATCQKIIEQTRLGPFEPAAVYGRLQSGVIDERVRKASRLNPPSTTVEFVKQRLVDYKHDVERHFRVSLKDVEDPQFLRYQEGDFFVAHQDGNTGLIQLETEGERKISIVIFLNNQSDEPMSGAFRGGALKFSNHRAEPAYRKFSTTAEVGTLVAFRAELTHEVTPVTYGERYSIVGWYI